MTGIATFPARVRFTNDNGTLTPEALRLLESMVSQLGGDLGFHGDEVFSSISSGNGDVSALAQFAGVTMQSDGGAPYMADLIVQPAAPEAYFPPLDIQPANQEPYMAPMEYQPPAFDQLWSEMIMQPDSPGGSPFVAVTPGASPYAYTANRHGVLSVQAGTISAITVTRAGTAVTVTGATLIPANTGDIVTITYTVAPTLNFLPR